MKTKILKRISITLLLALILIPFQINAQKQSEHELTLYVMPTLHPLNWENPSTLYKSLRNCMLKTVLRSDNYLLGHVAIRLKSTSLSEPILIAQTSGKMSEKLDLIFKEKVGFALLGLPICGRLETKKELEHNLNVYRRRNKLAFIRYQINEKAVERIINFIQAYSSRTNEEKAACEYYGGAFWPRYHDEGAGCSAFGMAILDIINLLADDSENWKMEVKIPMDIIGGEINNGKKIKIRDIKKTTSWFSENGIPNQDYIDYQVYEPSLMFDWILNTKTKNDSKYISIEENSVPGLLLDAREINFDEKEDFFHKRTEPNLFIDYFKNTIKNNSN